MKCKKIKYYKDGEPIYVPKKAYDTLDEAIVAAKHMNARRETIHKLTSYKCDECFKYHIGKSKYILKDKDREKYRKELRYD